MSHIRWLALDVRLLMCWCQLSVGVIATPRSFTIGALVSMRLSMLYINSIGLGCLLSDIIVHLSLLKVRPQVLLQLCTLVMSRCNIR